jgi:hypothetical protein
MLIRLTEVCEEIGLRYSLREVFVNPEHVVMIREDHQLKAINQDNAITEGLDRAHRFSKITIDKGSSGTEIRVVGDPQMIESLLKTNKRTLIRG